MLRWLRNLPAGIEIFKKSRKSFQTFGAHCPESDINCNIKCSDKIISSYFVSATYKLVVQSNDCDSRTVRCCSSTSSFVPFRISNAQAFISEEDFAAPEIITSQWHALSENRMRSYEISYYHQPHIQRALRSEKPPDAIYTFLINFRRDAIILHADYVPHSRSPISIFLVYICECRNVAICISAAWHCALANASQSTEAMEYNEG